MENIEKRIAGRLVTELLKGGENKISVFDGEEYCLVRNNDFETVMKHLMTTESDTIVVRTGQGVKLGSFYLIYGNEEDVISDHTDNEYCTKVFDVVLNDVRRAVIAEVNERYSYLDRNGDE
jgi:hypothetical protein